MSRGLTMTRGHRTGAIMMSHGGTRMEGTRSDVTWTHGDMRTEVTHPCNVTWTRCDMRMEGTDNSDVTWAHCDTRMEGTRCSDVTWMRGQIEVMSHGLTMT